MKRRIFGTVFLVFGIVMVAASLLLVGRNLWVEEVAGVQAQAAMDKLMAYVPETTRPAPKPEKPVTLTGNDGAVITESLAGMQQAPVADMPKVVIDGVPYIGYLEIPAIDLKLPVIGESNEDNLEIAPCRFYGTVYQKNFVIGGHRYRRHFRKLKTLGYGDRVSFTTMDGSVFTYTVADCEVIEPYEAEYLCTGNWDLSLYTCTPGGLTRVVLRCLRAA